MRVAVTQANYIPCGSDSSTCSTRSICGQPGQRPGRESLLHRPQPGQAARWDGSLADRGTREGASRHRDSRRAAGSQSGPALPQRPARNYRGAPHFNGCRPWLTDLLTPRPGDSTLALHNERIVRQLAADLGIAVEVRRASELATRSLGHPAGEDRRGAAGRRRYQLAGTSGVASRSASTTAPPSPSSAFPS